MDKCEMKRPRTNSSSSSTQWGSLEVVSEIIDTDESLSKIRDQVKVRLSHHSDPGHDFSHMMRVALWTIRLNREGSERNSIAAALLHDLVNPPKNDPQSRRASEYSAEEAKHILTGLRNFSTQDIQDICEAIRDHSFSRGAKPSTLLGMALQDADRLEALGVLGMFRNISCGTRMDASFFHPQDPWNQNNKRELNDKKYSMDHYPLKLFRLESTMNTEAGAQEAKLRTDRMRRILVDLGEEIGFSYSHE